MTEVDTIAEAMLEKKAENVCALDLKKIGTAITDWFVICNADSTTQVAAIADNIEERMIENAEGKWPACRARKTASGSSSTTSTL